QLTLEQRYKIEALIKAGHTQSAIADLLGVHRSTICRELNRNAPKRGIGAGQYQAPKADQKARQRHLKKPKHIRLTPDLKQQACLWMEERRFSPELIGAEWKKQGIDGVSHETLCRFIWDCKHSNKSIHKEYKNLYTYLRHGRRKRKRGNYKDFRGMIPNRVPIDKRPKIVEKRKRFGDLEAGLVMGKAHGSALLVTTDRATLLTTIEKLTAKDASQVRRKLIARLKKLPSLKTITFDNDQAFRYHGIIAKELNVRTYFTRPYTSQDKGTVEKRNGIIRMFFPPKTDFKLIDKAEIKRVEKELNNRPVRKFGYLNPNEVFSRWKGSVALTG
ncbi:MAG TPA: IS30 family transposase, partial [Lacibacter sp.]|nr:IS30 family transposase [Lacibacter sp.]